MPFTETVERCIEKLDGAEYPVTVTRRKGTHLFKPPQREEAVLVDAVTIRDYGAKLGSTIIYTAHREYSEEERAAGRTHVCEAAQETQAP